jgi:uncharacterized protein YqeY
VSLKEQIINDTKAALLGGDRFRGEVLRGMKAVILNEEVAQGKRDEGIDEATIEQLLAREVKKRKESADIYDKAGRPELSENERAEAKIIAEYLPKQLSESEILDVIKRIVSEMGVSSPSAMGQVIGAVKKELGNSADGAIVAKLVKDTLK